MENRPKSNASSQLLVIKKPNKNFWKIPTTLPSKKRTLDGQNIIFSAGNGQTKSEDDIEEGTEGDDEAATEEPAEETTEESIEGPTEELAEEVTEETIEESTEGVVENGTVTLSRRKRQISVELEPIEVYLENDQVYFSESRTVNIF